MNLEFGQRVSNIRPLLGELTFERRYAQRRKPRPSEDEPKRLFAGADSERATVQAMTLLCVLYLSPHCLMVMTSDFYAIPVGCESQSGGSGFESRWG